MIIGIKQINEISEFAEVYFIIWHSEFMSKVTSSKESDV